MLTTIKQDLFNESQYPLHRLGQKAVDEWGSVYRYVKAGGVALAAGHLLQESAEDTAFRSMAVQAAAAIGDTEINVTLGGTATTANLFDGGELVVESSTGLGQWFRILSHDVAASGTCGFVVDRPLKVALTTSSQVSVRRNAYNQVIDFPVTPTGGPVGVALYAMTIAYHGWVVSGGDAIALFDAQTATAVDDTAIRPSSGVAGSVSKVLEADGAVVHLGWSKEQVSVVSTMGLVHLTID